MQKYFQFVAQVKVLNQRFDLSHFEIELLDMAAWAHFSHKPIFVGDLIYQKTIASQATLHASLKSLVGKKLLFTQVHEDDGRIKKVTLTRLALEHYKRLFREIKKVTTERTGHAAFQ